MIEGHTEYSEGYHGTSRNTHCSVPCRYNTYIRSGNQRTMGGELTTLTDYLVRIQRARFILQQPASSHF
jgi:hypothetical protein